MLSATALDQRFCLRRQGVGPRVLRPSRSNGHFEVGYGSASTARGVPRGRRKGRRFYATGLLDIPLVFSLGSFQCRAPCDRGHWCPDGITRGVRVGGMGTQGVSKTFRGDLGLTPGSLVGFPIIVQMRNN